MHAAGQRQPVVAELQHAQLRQLAADLCHAAPAAEQVVCEVQLHQVGSGGCQRAGRSLQQQPQWCIFVGI